VPLDELLPSAAGIDQPPDDELAPSPPTIPDELSLTTPEASAWLK
jgi:hypothetical protein